jgi:hypothetical protein
MHYDEKDTRGRDVCVTAMNGSSRIIICTSTYNVGVVW